MGLFNFSIKLGKAPLTFARGNGWPMTPVEANKICLFEIFFLSEKNFANSIILFKPCLPVYAFAFLVLTSKALISFLFALIFQSIQTDLIEDFV